MEHRVATRQVRFEAGEDDDDGNTLVGLAVPFGQTTRINDPWEGEFDEQFGFGSMQRSLDHRTPVLQFDHGTHPLIGSIPLGRFERLKEIKRGLDVRAPLFENWLVEPVRDAIRGRAITGMSIRFRPIRIEITAAESRTDVEDADVPLHTIREAELIELGPVVFPAYPQTEADVRSLDLRNEVDRHRLAQALLGGVDLAGGGQPKGPGTDPPEAGSPAGRTDPATRHSDPGTPRRNRRDRTVRLIELTRS